MNTVAFTPKAAASVRGPNEVELLLKVISLIQEKCVHEYEIRPSEFFLIPSKEEGVFIAEDHTSKVCNGRFKVQCKFCSLEKEMHVRSSCPNCLSSDLYTSKNVKKRDVYFSERRGVYTALLIICNMCEFKYVVDEIDI